MTKLAPSILAADFARLGQEVIEVENAGADRIHVDVMDGHFVPNCSLGAVIVAGLRKVTRLPLETHMMLTNPDLFLEQFSVAGSDFFLVYWEGNPDLHRTVPRIRAPGRPSSRSANVGGTQAPLLAWRVWSFWNCTPAPSWVWRTHCTAARSSAWVALDAQLRQAYAHLNRLQAEYSLEALTNLGGSAPHHARLQNGPRQTGPANLGHLAAH